VSTAELIIEAGPRPRLRQALRELWAYRALVLAFAERNIRVMYKQAVLGIAWAVIQPLAFMTVFTLTLGRLAKVPGGGVPYAAFALSALTGWTFLQSAVSFGANALLSDGALVRKVYFPREIPIFGAILASGLDFGIALVLFAIVGPFLGAHPSPVWLIAPLLGVVLALLAAGVALTTAALNVYYRDFRYALPFMLQLWLFASPVAYPLSVVPKAWRGLYVGLNPAAGVLDAFRNVLALGRSPDLPLLALSVGVAVVLATIGYRIFKRLEPGFADVV
jgi:ABC-type polysaccharide/polyol phosphate export permease